MHSALAPLLLAIAFVDRPDLSGTVSDEEGKPLAGASVFIHSASVRKGTSTFCPSCYPDCAKRATTDAKGRFTIRELDPELLFRVLVVGDGREPVFANKVDPAAGSLEVASKPRDVSALDPKRLVQGRVVDEDGKPVVGATLEPKMFRTEEYGGFKPGVFDPISVTDLNGQFVITSRSDIESVSFRVEGPRLAPLITDRLTPAPAEHVITLQQGAFVRGRVTWNGEPLAGVPLALAQADHSADSFLGPNEIATDVNGVFLFSNIHPDEYVLFGLMAGMPKDAAIEIRNVSVGDRTVDVGTIEAKPGGILYGRVVLSDGKSIPPNTRIAVGRRDAWDSLTIELDPEGRFEARGLPPELYSLSVYVRGYRYSRRNRSIDPLNGSPLGRLGDQKTNRVTLLLEPGGRLRDPRLKDSGVIPREVVDELEHVKESPLVGILPDEEAEFAERPSGGP